MLSVVAAVLVLTAPVRAGEMAAWTHALSLVGEPKYGPGAAHTDYVNPQAPVGGEVRLGALGSFNSTNLVLAGRKGNVVSGLFRVYESLSLASLDEPATEYGLLAEAMAIAPDRASMRIRLRAEARWHDGRPVTADDVLFSFETWRRLHPQINLTFREVAGMEAVSPREVLVRFRSAADRTLPVYVGQLLILPRHWWQGVGPDGQPRDIEKTTLEPPLGSGPYRLAALEPGRSVTYERVPAYWGRRHPLRVGTENFGRIHISYFRDAEVLFEAFRADLVDYRREDNLKAWVTGYDFAEGNARVVREEFPVARLGIARGLVLNQRRGPLADARVRRALALVFDFEAMNASAFNGLRRRANSHFPQTDFAASGPADEAERRLAATLGLPATVLETLPARPDGERQLFRGRLRRALHLLAEAGYSIREGRLVDAAGEQMSLELLLEDPGADRYLAHFVDGLGKLGIQAQLRPVDGVQYQNRLRSFDFDMVIHAWAHSHAPGSEQMEYWGSASASQPGTHNLAGIMSPQVDALVAMMVEAPARADRITAGRLLDRLLTHGRHIIPLWVEDREYVAHAAHLSHPAAMPRFGASAFPSIWWYDKAKAKQLKTGR
jgi:microcin C transport system substrate-binding protein